jgi:hypothetical protein
MIAQKMASAKADGNKRETTYIFYATFLCQEVVKN